MKVFVTGSTGFLGARVVSQLCGAGHDVTALVRAGSDSTELEGQGATVVYGELENVDGFAASLEGCGGVIHAGAHVQTSGDWSVFHNSNVLGTHRLIEASVAAGVRRFVHVSSLGIFELGRGRSEIEVDEEQAYDRKPLLRGHYTRSKIHADRAAMAALKSGAPVVVVRPGVLYGPGRPLFRGRVSKRLGPLRLVVSRASYPVPICYVENAAEALVLAATTPGVDGQVFNLVDDSALRQREYFSLLAAAESSGAKVVYLPPALLLPAIRAVAFLFKLLKRRQWTPAYQFERSARNASYSNTRAREILGWSATVATDEALRRSADAGK
ncbi:MAG: NAD-dependent epimerase/dehydratase family protein [Proteobacteria bacterium]|nr:NAD-dependent epimerase/dehydratase family protein [Pseudomonadota bacterium]